MTDQYSIEQIEAAMKAAHYPSNSDAVIAELTKPVWRPQEGEVVAHKNNENDYLLWPETRTSGRHYRSLTPDEVPGWKTDKAALKVAIAALTTLMGGDTKDWYYQECAKYLAKIKELTTT